MAYHPLINMLIVDRSLSDIEQVAKILRNAGYLIQLSHADQEKVIRGIIEDKPLDLIIARPVEHLPTIAKVHNWITDTRKDIPILAMVDAHTPQKPAEILRSGAQNLFHLDDPEHLVAVVSNELRHLETRRQAHHYQKSLEETEQRFRSLLDSSHEAIAYTHEGVHIYANPVYLKLFGYTSEEDLAAVTLVNMVVPQDRDTLKAFLRRYDREARADIKPIDLTGLRRDCSSLPLQMECIPIRINDESCLQIIIRDLSQPAELQQQFDEFTKRDSLTGLYNRKFISQYLEQINSKPGKMGGAVLYILLTGYRSISERLGLEAVDQMVIDMAQVVEQNVRESDIVARFSDATFIVYTRDSSRKSVQALGEKIRNAIKEQITHTAQKLITTSCCIGIYMIGENKIGASQILSHADRACETARQMGGDQVQIYRPLINAGEPQHDEEIIGLIQEAISEDRLGLLYQPIASLRDEAKERYKLHLCILDDNQQPLPLRNLAPVAERCKLMGSLDKWVIARGIEALLARQREGHDTTLFIRISCNSVNDETFIDWLDAHLETNPGLASALVLEIDEDSAERYFKEIKTWRERLRQSGCGFALSHFGERSHSERIAQHLSPSYIKLDSALIDKLAANPAHRQSLAGLIEQFKTMDIGVIAENVASAPQLANIWQFGITLVQGSVVQERGPMMNFDFQQFAN